MADDGRTPDHQRFALGRVVLQAGVTLPDAYLAYATYGELNTAGDNAVLMPTFFAGQHPETELMMAPGRALDPAQYYVIVPNALGNGLSSSPSTTPPPFDGPSFPAVTLYDNVTCQHRLVTEHLGLTRLRLVVGYSVGAQQAYQWGALYPEVVEAVAPICGTAATSAHNARFLEGAAAALTMASDFEDGRYPTPPVRGLVAFSKVFSSALVSSDFYRHRQYAKLGLASPADTSRFFEGFLRRLDANDLLCSLSMWQHGDISANPVFEGDLRAARSAIAGRVTVLASSSDFFFQPPDVAEDVDGIAGAELRRIESSWGHMAGFGANPDDNAVIDAALRELLGP